MRLLEKRKNHRSNGFCEKRMDFYFLSYPFPVSMEQANFDIGFFAGLYGYCMMIQARFVHVCWT